MKRILESYNMDKREQYNVLSAGVGKRLSQHVDETFEVKAFAVTETTNDSTGEVSVGFTFVTPDGEYYGTSSRAFVEGVRAFLEVFGAEELTHLTVGARTSKSGRSYIVLVA